MKAIYIILIGAILTALVHAQENSYWKLASAEGLKIYSVKFFDDGNGIAESEKNVYFITSDKGENWIVKEGKAIQEAKVLESAIYWSADIYCSVLNTSDGGCTWHVYSKEQQNHFCAVYLKDENTGYKSGNEFLAKVVKKINDDIKNSQIAFLVNNPQQCTEYYSDENSGWALGWCLKNFVCLKN